MNFKSKRGQGLSLNAIIIAALALIVLVVLSVLFIGKTADTAQDLDKVSGDASLELTKMKLRYGDCRPDSTSERAFQTDYSEATSPAEQDAARSSFVDIINDCKRSESKTVCDQTSGCRWKE